MLRGLHTVISRLQAAIVSVALGRSWGLALIGVHLGISRTGRGLRLRMSRAAKAVYPFLVAEGFVSITSLPAPARIAASR